ncbi:serine/threonine-protein kinase [Planotetraspora thailandica]|nr:serine/threonine-protein kinase [Planotetraspora thailandica]
MTDAQTSERVVAGRYRLIEPLGRGGMGTVWRALDDVLRREVAVKEITAATGLIGADRDAFTARTFREARAAGRLSHPGVATVYDVFEERGHLWIVLELVPSRTLGSIVRDDGPLPPRRVAEIGIQVLAALRAAHAAGVLHRDVKPENVLIAHDGRAVLTDFGIASIEDDSSMTRTGILIGTPAFMAPERASGGTAQRASDLWSLGVTLFHAVEGRSPFERAHALATLAAVTYEEPDPARLAGQLGPIIDGLLVKDPARRMTAEEAEPLLIAVAEPSGPSPDPGPAVRKVRPRRARPGTTPSSGFHKRSAPDAGTRMPASARRASRRRPWIFTVVATAAIAVAGMSAGGVAYVTSRAPEPGAAPLSVPTVTVFTTRTAKPDDKQAASQSMTNASTPSEAANGDTGKQGRRTPAPQVAPRQTRQAAPHHDDNPGRVRGDYAGSYQQWRGKFTGSRR